MDYVKSNVFEVEIQQNGPDGQKGPGISIMVVAESFGDAEEITNHFTESEHMLAPRISKIKRCGIVERRTGEIMTPAELMDIHPFEKE